MKVPTDEELSLQKTCRESTSMWVPPQEIIANYHTIFLELGRQKGLSSVDDGLYDFDLHPDPNPFTLTFDPSDDDTEILRRIAERRTKPRGYEPLFIEKYVKDQREKPKKVKDIVSTLETAIKVYEHGRPFEATARALGWIQDTRDDKQCKRAARKAERYYKLAERLIDAVMQGKFLEELSKPLRDL